VLHESESEYLLHMLGLLYDAGRRWELGAQETRIQLTHMLTLASASAQALNYLASSAAAAGGAGMAPSASMSNSLTNTGQGWLGHSQSSAPLTSSGMSMYGDMQHA
jgi:hypothetical protein